MIGGLDPILLIHIDYSRIASDKITTLPKVLKDGSAFAGIPIPFYLAARYAVKIIGENQTMEIVSEEGVQRKISNQIILEMVYNADNQIVAALVAAMNFAYQNINSDSYRVSYFGKGTYLWQGKLLGVTIASSENTTARKMTIRIGFPEEKPKTIADASVPDTGVEAPLIA